jgi:hypothetical protein
MAKIENKIKENPKLEQNKTKGHSASSGVVIPLNDGLLSVIGTPPEDSNLDNSVFTLPSYESCCKSVKRWSELE